MFNFFHKKYDKADNHSNKPKLVKRFIITLLLLAAFIVMSIVTGIKSGTFREMDFGFRFHFSDGAALVVLAAAYLIYRIKRGRNDGE